MKTLFTKNRVEIANILLLSSVAMLVLGIVSNITIHSGAILCLLGVAISGIGGLLKHMNITNG